MTVAEVVQTLLELDQKSECFFVKRSDYPHILVVASLPNGQRAATDMPTAVLKEANENTKEKKSERSNRCTQQ